jgi:hypothetical protein
MPLKLNGTNSVAAPAYAGDDADTGLQCGTDELKLVTGGTERVTVDSSGQVGIGTDSPSARLEVRSGVTPLTIRRNSDAGDLVQLRNNNFYYVISGDNGDLYFKTNGTAFSNERLRITSTGLVGIGTSNPTSDVEFNSSTYTALAISSEKTSGLIGGIKFNADSAGTKTQVSELVADQDGGLEIRQGPTTVFKLDSSGDLGVGTSSPGVKLAVSGTDAIQIPVGTTAERPTAAAGQIRLNTTHGYYEGYDGTNWTNLRTLVQTYIASGTQSVNNTSFSAISVIDNNQSLSDSLTTESAGIYTFARAGIYEVYIGLTVDGAATNYRWTCELSATKNGTSNVIHSTKGGYIRSTGGADETFVNMTFIHEFAAGNTVRFRIRRISDTTGTATIVSSSSVTFKALKTTD